MARKSETKASKSPMTGKGALGTRSAPWTLKTPSLQSEFIAFRDEDADPPALVVQVGKTELRYHFASNRPRHRAGVCAKSRSPRRRRGASSAPLQ